VSRGIGAYRFSISISTRVEASTCSDFLTWPTVTPEIRTSALSASWVASWKSAWKR
jgi:hypothetical protein